jgi:CheY-like chemotaxis protein
LNKEDLVHQPGLLAGQYLKLSVMDTGMGMNIKTQERIFDPFYTTKAVNEGTGMGLSIVMGIIKNHGGMITVESEPGEGSTFNMFFPIIASAVTQKVETSESLLEGNEKILFVDDEELLATLGGRILERLGYQVETQTSANVALENFISDPNKFDLVITDQTMPNITGTELASELLTIRPDIPIILCTGFSNKINKSQAIEMGIKEFCDKPLGLKLLAQTVRKVLDDNKA